MAHITTIADAVPARSKLVRPVAAVVGVFAVASVAATWVAGPELLISRPLALKDQGTFFDVRFPAAQPPPSESEIKLRIAKGLLAQKLRDGGWDRPASEAPPAAIMPAVPLPRPRPLEAALPPRENEIAGSEDQTLLQKLSELFRPRVRLASLTPDDGVSGDAPNLAALGYDGLTAVYDISARAVYMPNGSRLEAHSGFGDAKDDPRHVSEQNVGATPPAVYTLKLRERPFHGAQALRMTPAEGNTLGRSGLLAHGYMLGPDGDSNGCVSIKDYNRFLAAFQKGEINRLVVVLSIADLARQSSL